MKAFGLIPGTAFSSEMSGHLRLNSAISASHSGRGCQFQVTGHPGSVFEERAQVSQRREAALDSVVDLAGFDVHVVDRSLALEVVGL